MATSPPIAPLLMQREMTDPTEALPVIVREFIRPMMEELEAIVARLAPDLDEIDVTRSAMSIVGQALFYQFAKPAVLRVLGETRYSRDLASAVAESMARQEGLKIRTTSILGLEASFLEVLDLRMR